MQQVAKELNASGAVRSRSPLLCSSVVDGGHVLDCEGSSGHLNQIYDGWQLPVDLFSRSRQLTQVCFCD